MNSPSLQADNKLPFESGWRPGLLEYRRAILAYVAVAAANLILLGALYGLIRAPLVVAIGSGIVAIISVLYAINISLRLRRLKEPLTGLSRVQIQDSAVMNLTDVPGPEELPSEGTWLLQTESMLFQVMEQIATYQLLFDAVLKRRPADTVALTETITAVASSLETLRQRIDEQRKYVVATKASKAGS
jgi:hypothetical protein